MFRNGIYKIDYRNPFEDGGLRDDALVVLRDGKIIGADRHGGIYTGEPKYFGGCNDGPEESIAVQMAVPPGGELINGITVGPAGASFEVVGRFDPTLDRQTAIIDVGGGAYRTGRLVCGTATGVTGRPHRFEPLPGSA